MKSIITVVDKLVKKYSTNCPFKIARHLGIEIMYENLGQYNLGYYNKKFRVKMIHINQNAGERQKIFICAHELSHAICHPDANTPFLKKNTFFSTEKIEMEANYFAVRLLFSKEYFKEEVSLTEAIYEYGIPEQLVFSVVNSKNF
ncbi:ImmA/IrrE family metallo-endopeptidase [Bacillus sp. CGMCC 1.16607]|uniref:ImmA/IrrE family metallo-endopeptidase n=1 Tax=Bacillus sp. CGMCC 1.16607 TaxID=3351842 RepID=UPI003629A084